MTSVRVIVDDRVEDGSVLTYAGTWGPAGNAGVEFNGTTEFTLSKGASNTLYFDGSSVELIATQFQGEGLLNLSCVIDSGSPTEVQLKEGGSVGYHKTFFKTDVPDGRHTLTTTVVDEGITLCIDYFIYTTTLERIVELKKPVMVLIDDTDTSSIIYGGPWATISTTDQALGHTEHIASSENSNATFNFYGTYVGAFGTTSSARASSAFVIDGSIPAIFNSPPTSSKRFGQKLFEQTLEDGPHSLVITLRNDAEFSLDYILYRPSLSEAIYDTPLPSSGSPSNPTTAPTPSPSGSTPSETGVANGSSSSNTGAIVGGVVGGVVGLLAISLAAFFLLRKKRGSTSLPPLNLDGGSPNNDSASPYRGHSTVMSQDFDPLTLSPHSQVANSSYGAPSTIASGTITSTSDVRSQALDGGVRVLASVDDEDLRPPAYRPDYLTHQIKT